jgi:magnesium transporter
MSGEPDVLDEVTPEFVRRVETALVENRVDDVRALLTDLSATGQASILEQVSEPERDKLIGILKRDLDPEALTELDEEVLEDVLDQLDSKEIAAAARELETDDAATILEDLPEEERREVLAELPPAERAEIESALAYPEDTAGRLMQRSLVKIPDGWTVGQVIDHCREATDLPDDG